MTWLGRCWSRLAGAPMRTLARRLSSQLPRTSYDGLDLLVGDPRLVLDAERFFAQTIEALRCAAARAPTSYARLRKDVSAIVLRSEAASFPYHRFQLAALVPVKVALEADALAYAAWLLYTSGLSRGSAEAVNRAAEFLRAVDPDQRDRVRAWLPHLDG